jgi:hypothetical protein
VPVLKGVLQSEGAVVDVQVSWSFVLPAIPAEPGWTSRPDCGERTLVALTPPTPRKATNGERLYPADPLQKSRGNKAPASWLCGAHINTASSRSVLS